MTTVYFVIRLVKFSYFLVLSFNFLENIILASLTLNFYIFKSTATKTDAYLKQFLRIFLRSGYVISSFVLKPRASFAFERILHWLLIIIFVITYILFGEKNVK